MPEESFQEFYENLLINFEVILFTDRPTSWEEYMCTCNQPYWFIISNL